MNNFFLQADLVLNIIMLIQGIVFGFILLKGVKKQQHLLYLGLLIVFYSLDSFDTILSGVFKLSENNYFILIPSDFSFIISPLLYVYVQKIPDFKEDSFNYNGLYLGTILYLITFFLFFLPIQTKLIIESSIIYFLFGLVSIFFSVHYICISYIFLRDKKNELKDSFFENDYSEAKWAYNFVRTLLFSIIGLFIIVVILILFDTLYDINSSFSTFTFTLLDTIFLYIIIIYGLKHKYLKKFYEEFSNKRKKIAHGNKSNEEILEFKEIIENLSEFLQTSQAFKKNDFSITDASIALNIHTKKISTALNALNLQNFNSFINDFRIEEAKKLLKQNASSDYTIEGIGNLVGFKSKSVFYKEFKKCTGLTPLKYCENNFSNNFDR